MKETITPITIIMMMKYIGMGLGSSSIESENRNKHLHTPSLLQSSSIFPTHFKFIFKQNAHSL